MINDDGSEKADQGVNPTRRGILRNGLTAATIWLTVDKGAHGEDIPQSESDVPVEIPFGERVGPGLRRHIGKGITVYWRGRLCIHARHCVTDGALVFTDDARWDLSKESVDHISHVIRKCPSGALKYERTDGGPQELTPRVNTIHLVENGPLAMHADLRLPNGVTTTRATLCRCGKSDNMPYCDGAHVANEFRATGETKTKDTTRLANRGGQLTVTPLLDGPLQVSGNVEICAGSGRVIYRASSVTLCRCGNSGSMPFCDGSHVSSGFIATGS